MSGRIAALGIAGLTGKAVLDGYPTVGLWVEALLEDCLCCGGREAENDPCDCAYDLCTGLCYWVKKFDPEGVRRTVTPSRLREVRARVDGSMYE